MDIFITGKFIDQFEDSIANYNSKRVASVTTASLFLSLIIYFYQKS